MEKLASKATQTTLLDNIKKSIRNNQNIIPIQGTFYFTKGQPGETTGYILRDKYLEENVFNWINTRTSFETLIQKYKKYDTDLSCLDWPCHYATRFININGNAAEANNIFMFFPEVLGLSSGKLEDYFGFEFIDMWVSVFDEIIFPCMRKVFDESTQLELYGILRPALEKTVYLAAVFHEIGHRCGYWKVSPNKHSQININKFHTDVLGELSTDTLLVNFLEEFPEITYFVFLQRIFWFGRFGFKNNRLNGMLNKDNDTWIAAFLWNQYINNKVITQNKDKSLHIDFQRLKEAFLYILKDTDSLGENVVKQRSGQDFKIRQWMIENVKTTDGQFLYPKSLQAVFMKCLDIPEKPSAKY